MRPAFYGITDEQWKQLCAFFDGKCPRCGKDTKMSVDHITPVSKGGKHYDIRNMQPLCLTCNQRKRFGTTDYRPQHVKDWAKAEYENQGEIRDAPSPVRPVSVNLSTEQHEQVRQLRRLDKEFPRGTTSIVREGIAMVWAKYGKLAEVLDETARRISEEARKARTGEIDD